MGEPSCKTCGVRERVQAALDAGTGPLAIAVGVGQPCANCTRNPIHKQVRGMMLLLGLSEGDHFEPAGAEGK